MADKILTVPNRLLLKKCIDVSFPDGSRVQSLLERLRWAMKGAGGVGLAAPQIGVCERVAVVAYHASHIEMINPEIIWRDEEEEVALEGCLSIPGVELPVIRAKRIKVLTAPGRQPMDANGLLARTIQHEIDHLDGILITQRVEEQVRRLHSDILDARQEVYELTTGIKADRARELNLTVLQKLTAYAALLYGLGIENLQREVEKVMKEFESSISRGVTVSPAGATRMGVAEPAPRVQVHGNLISGKSLLPKIVCLCGSTRFYSYFQEANYKETMAGNIILTVGYYEGVLGTPTCSAEQKQALDDLHLRKIDLCDEVLVLNINNYIGKSTKSEIWYARKIGKPIRYFAAEHSYDHNITCPPCGDLDGCHKDPDVRGEVPRGREVVAT